MNLGYHANPCIVGICATTSAASVLWISSLAASRVTPLSLGLKIISSVIVFGSFFFQVDHPVLRDATSATAGTSYLPYIFTALPVCLVSFGSHGNIPSLTICYGKRKDKSVRSVVFGSLLALVTYLFWLYCTMGNILCENSKAIISSGGNADSPVKPLLGTKQHGIIEFCLLAFPNLAAVSSFFGVTSGLSDYLADLFKIGNFHGGRFKTALLTFLLPALLYLIFPNSFIYGIGGAGPCATIWVVIIPTVPAIKVRKKLPNQMFVAWGGNLISVIVILFGIIVVPYWFGDAFNVLPKFG